MTRETERETKQAELHLQPFLEAEKDRMVIRALHETRRYEEFLMKDRPDWKVNEGSKIFHTRKYVPEHMMAHPDSEIFKFPIFRECSKLFN